MVGIDLWQLSVLNALWEDVRRLARLSHLFVSQGSRQQSMTFALEDWVLLQLSRGPSKPCTDDSGVTVTSILKSGFATG